MRGLGLERIPLRGPLGITVPGAVRSWGKAHARWGRLSRDAVLAPAIEHAAAGFPAWDGLVARDRPHRDVLAREPWSDGFRSVWQPHGRAPRPGERVRLEALAAHPADARRRGLRRLLRRRPGRADRARPGGAPARRSPPTTCATRVPSGPTPIATTYRGARVTTHPPNSSGLVALEILAILGRFDPPSAARFDGRGWSDPGWIHLAARGGQARLRGSRRPPRRPGLRRGPRRSAPGRRPRRRAGRRASTPRPPTSPRRPPASSSAARSTSPSSTRDGNAVSLIQSNAAGFGSGVLDPETGVHFQNRGASFSLDPASVNVLEPGKRPAHTLLPGHGVPRGRAAAVGGRGLDGRRHPAADPRPARLGARRRRRRHRHRRRRAAGRRRAGRVPRAAGRGVHRRRARAGRRRGPRPARPRPRRASRSTAASGTSTRSSWSTAARPAGGTLAAATDPRSFGLPAVR